MTKSTRMTTAANGVRTVLLVEDHADTIEALVRALTRRGYRAVAATTAAEARARAAADWPDVMVVDLMLPDGSGVDLVRELRAMRPVRAVAFSGLGTHADRRQTAEAGFAAHVTKPATIDELDRAIRKASAA